MREVLRSSKTPLLPTPGAGELLHSEDAICHREVGGYYPLDVDLRILNNLRPIVAVPDEDGVL